MNLPGMEGVLYTVTDSSDFHKIRTVGLQYIKKYLLKGTQEKIPDTMVETVLCFHPHCTTKRRGVKPEEEPCSKPVSPAEIGTYGKKITAVSCQL